MTALRARRDRQGKAALLGALAATLLLVAPSCRVAVDMSSAVDVEPASALAPDRSDRLDGADTPPFAVSDEWPVSVRPYVAFVQETRGEPFELIADVRFADPADVIAEYQADYLTIDDLPAEARIIVARLDDMYRALGLTNEDFDILDTSRSVAGDIAAFYDTSTGEIVFPSAGGEVLEEIPIADQPVLVHELGHALQAHGRLEWAEQIEDLVLSTALIEGEAEWLFDQYLISLTDEEWFAWNDSLPPDAGPSGLPEILEVEFAVPYVLGSRFFHARHGEAGLAGIDAVFDDDAVVTTQMLLEPWLFGGKAFQETFGYTMPPTRGPGEYIDLGYDFPISAVTWHQVLGAAMPGVPALEAARGINSFTVPTAWVGPDDRLCFSVLVSAAPGRERSVEAGFSAWASTPGVSRWFDITEHGYDVGGCDPGPGQVPEPRATPGDILTEAAVVLDAETWAVEEGLPPSAGFCVGWDFLAAVEQDGDLDAFAWYESIDTAALPRTC